MKMYALTAVLLLTSSAAQAQDGGYWKALSTTARGITGDIGISGEKLTISFATFTIADIRLLTADESAAVFDFQPEAQGTGKLYRLNIPAKRVLLHRNTMCGAEDTQWMATFASGKSLQTAFFSGSTMPVFTREAVGNSTALCGTFSYSR